MSVSLRTAAVAAAIAATGLLTALPAAAGPALVQGPYVAASVGTNIVSDLRFNNGPIDFPLDTDNGFNVNVAAGWALPWNLRVEGTYGYRRNSTQKFGPLTANGDLTSHSLLANVWYDLPLGLPVTPYVGGGVGWSRLSADEVRAGFISFDQSDAKKSGFAWQVGAGVAWPISDSVAVTADYRYFQMPSVTLAVAPGLTDDVSYSNHSVTVGLRWSFGSLLFN